MHGGMNGWMFTLRADASVNVDLRHLVFPLMCYLWVLCESVQLI